MPSRFARICPLPYQGEGYAIAKAFTRVLAYPASVRNYRKPSSSAVSLPNCGLCGCRVSQYLRLADRYPIIPLIAGDAPPPPECRCLPRALGGEGDGAQRANDGEPKQAEEDRCHGLFPPVHRRTLQGPRRTSLRRPWRQGKRLQPVPCPVMEVTECCEGEQDAATAFNGPDVIKGTFLLFYRCVGAWS